jgi:hypothetical protein
MWTLVKFQTEIQIRQDEILAVVFFFETDREEACGLANLLV